MTAAAVPDLVKQWQHGSDLLTTWEVGTPIIFRNEWNGGVFEQKGKVLEFLPESRLKYSLFVPHLDLQDIPEHTWRGLVQALVAQDAAAETRRYAGSTSRAPDSVGDRVQSGGPLNLRSFTLALAQHAHSTMGYRWRPSGDAAI